MAVYEIQTRSVLAPLFEGWEETFIWSYLQGYMGKAYGDDLNHPQAGKIIVGDFCWLAGRPCEELVWMRDEDMKSGGVIIAPQNKAWQRVIEQVYGAEARKWTRYRIKREPDVFDEGKLRQIAAGLPLGYQLRLIDESLYHQAIASEWARDLCINFPSYEDYKKYGLGVVALRNGVIVSGASSYIVYDGGIEIEIDTREDERRKGLASACGASLILECLERGLYPSWDAHNQESLALAEKLGYHFDKEYLVYEIGEL